MHDLTSNVVLLALIIWFAQYNACSAHHDVIRFTTAKRPSVVGRLLAKLRSALARRRSKAD